MKDKIINVVNKAINKIHELVGKIIKWYVEYEDKKTLHLSVIAWFVTFFIIVIICKVNGNEHNSNQETRLVVEVESSIESETTEKKVLMKDEVETSSATEEITETSSEKITTNTIENETIDISKLDVSTTPIKDDVINGDNFVSINSADVKTMSSTVFESDRLSYGIDVSYHNGNIDWAKVKASGVEYAIIRVGNRGYESGKLCIDSKYKEYIRDAKANGIKVGVYFFSQAVNETEALEEASLTLNLIKGYSLDLPVVIDWETDVGYRTYSGISRTTMTNILSVYCDTIEGYGYESMVYMCKDDFVNRINTNTITSRYKTWVAWYFSEYATNNYSANFFKYGNLMPEMTFDYDIWQYSCKGRIDGIPVLTDLNVMILPKKVYDITLTVPEQDIVINMNGTANIRQGIKATDSSANDSTAEVSVTMVNANNKTVSESSAYKNPGKYIIKYFYQDINGQSITRTRNLYVRNKPLILFENKIIAENQIKTIEYVYDESISAEENILKLQDYIKNNTVARCFDLVEGVSNEKNCGISFDGFDKISINNGTKNNTYIITCIANDGKGLSNLAKINIVIIRNIEETTEKSTEETTEETTEEITS